MIAKLLFRRAKNIWGLDEFKRDGFGIFFDFLLGDVGRLVVSNCGCENCDVRFFDPMLDGIIHFLGAFHGNVVDEVRDIQMGRARYEDDAVALLGRGLSDGVTHFPGGFVS